MQVQVQTGVNPFERRWRVRRNVNIDLPRAETDHFATVRNLSENGLLLESVTPLQVGSTISINFPESGGCTAEVVWQQGHMHGCRFFFPLSRSAVSAAAPWSPIGDATLERQSLGPQGELPGEITKAEAPTSLSMATVVILAVSVLAAIVFIALHSWRQTGADCRS